MAWVYILKLSNGLYYTGSTTNIEQRLRDHQHGKSGYTCKHLPIELVFKQYYSNFSLARKTENYIKKMKSKKFIEKIIQQKVINLPHL